ncbi:flagellar motor switch protein G [Ameyamaea chiangmaiensis NBRC 103196]|uniref:Flagellar motor switch protein FliG n=1 Tax=Ameyamaea chiangmaiensis TaxID=442969 RepID=A0A850PDW4_9PROT|nr:flagellar motor switch protein FliG [Ameyamaea chiangmaiensis]MBS4074753.1 flagellar motor switch protein FliG [Ameyamaea chiangmaiensis]NVN40132.1 flagellar motor switch protein FliG [Ameyamaea chiangmaiensis]GBQ62619.1 flagellar motor switch protein G [Ameyamaea chiangmaiensis NBRC 103196]
MMLMKNTVSGVQKAAILMLALGEDSCAKLFEALSEPEIREISVAMSQLGTVPAETVESICNEFARTIASSEILVGSYESTERLLRRALSPERASQIMEEIRGPAGRTMWDKLGNVSETVLANYLKNEYPQTVAVILGKIRSDHAARVLSLLPEDFALDVMTRMLKMETVQKDVLDTLEVTLRSEFMANLSRAPKRGSHEQLAEVFNNFDRRSEVRFMEALEERSHDDAERIKALMFTFDDLRRLSASSMMRLLQEVERDRLPLALKGASEELRKHFMDAMSERAGKMLRDDMAALGPVRVKDVDAAQAEIVVLAKTLADDGEIELSETTQAGEMIQ